MIEVSGEAFVIWRLEAVGGRRACASDLLCERIPLQTEKKIGFLHEHPCHVITVKQTDESVVLLDRHDSDRCDM